ncbi:S1 RNA-binding domain-containing protein [Oscillatoria sp. FACHB-1407]|uniref:S1 RNA-binding domain-containing protein n=1 Tax=Oscillatoria sp. FACHB-1407 TaxID=2692847 RepID=UPI0016887A94|nr:S1 RNA-binding domain-containing protein [Oscillatoria sp. FACHB-1407]
MKRRFPIGHKFWGEVLRINPFGVFVNLGYPNRNTYLLCGIIDVATRSGCDSFGLPEDISEWPQVGQRVHCKVIAHREHNKQVDLRLVR